MLRSYCSAEPILPNVWSLTVPAGVHRSLCSLSIPSFTPRKNSMDRGRSRVRGRHSCQQGEVRASPRNTRGEGSVQVRILTPPPSAVVVRAPSFQLNSIHPPANSRHVFTTAGTLAACPFDVDTFITNGSGQAMFLEVLQGRVILCGPMNPKRSKLDCLGLCEKFVGVAHLHANPFVVGGPPSPLAVRTDARKSTASEIPQ